MTPCGGCPFWSCPGCEWQGGASRAAQDASQRLAGVSVGEGRGATTKGPQIGPYGRQAYWTPESDPRDIDIPPQYRALLERGAMGAGRGSEA